MTQFYSFQNQNDHYLALPQLNKTILYFIRGMEGSSLLTRGAFTTAGLLWKDYDQLGLLHISDNILSLEADEEYWGFALLDEQAEEMQKILNGNKFLDFDGVKKPGFLCSYEGQSNLLIRNPIFKKEIYHETNCN